MQKVTLKPFLRKELDILFVGLNPAKGSNENGHYFSVNQSFWNQLYKSGLIIENPDKLQADEKIFGSTILTFGNWSFGITDLITVIAESDSKKVKPQKKDCINLEKTIIQMKPKVVVILHSKVLKYFLKYLGVEKVKSNTGEIGKIISNNSTTFFNIAFPHGNTIKEEDKICRYKELLKYLKTLKESI